MPLCEVKGKGRVRQSRGLLSLGGVALDHVFNAARRQNPLTSDRSQICRNWLDLFCTISTRTPLRWAFSNL
jgi:hypothetical protein